MKRKVINCSDVKNTKDKSTVIFRVKTS